MNVGIEAGWGPVSAGVDYNMSSGSSSASSVSTETSDSIIANTLNDNVSEANAKKEVTTTETTKTTTETTTEESSGLKYGNINLDRGLEYDSYTVQQEYPIFKVITEMRVVFSNNVVFEIYPLHRLDALFDFIFKEDAKGQLQAEIDAYRKALTQTIADKLCISDYMDRPLPLFQKVNDKWKRTGFTHFEIMKASKDVKLTPRDLELEAYLADIPGIATKQWFKPVVCDGIKFDANLSPNTTLGPLKTRQIEAEIGRLEAERDLVIAQVNHAKTITQTLSSIVNNKDATNDDRIQAMLMAGPKDKVVDNVFVAEYANARLKKKKKPLDLLTGMNPDE